MSQSPFNNLRNGYNHPESTAIFNNEATVSEGNHTPEYDLGIVGSMNFAPSRFYPSHTDCLDYQQNNQLVAEPMLHDTRITDRPYEPNSYFVPPSTISLPRSPGPAEMFSTAPGTQVTSSAISKPGGISSYPFVGNYVGKSECEHRCTSQSQQLPSVADRGSDFQLTSSNRPRSNRNRNTNHRKLSCPVTGCERVGEKGFSRQDNLRQHRRNVHNEIIPKQRRRGTGTTHS